MNSKFIHIAFISISMFSCAERKPLDNVKYYSKITGIISPYMDYNPRGKLNKDSLDVPSYYRVVYDKGFRISEIAFYKMDNKSNESYFGTHKVTYTYNKSKLIRQYFDSNENKSNMSRHYYGGGSIHTEEFDLDASNNKKRLVLKDSIMNRVETGLGTYEYVWTTKNSKEFIQNQYKKNGSRNYLTAYFPFYQSKVVINDRGYLLSISNIDTINNTISMHKAAGYSKIVFDFDDYGNEKGWRFYNLEGDLSNRKSFAKMEYGYAQCLYDFSFRNEELGLSETFSMSFYDADSIAVNNNFNIHKTVFTCNENDDINAIAYFNKALQNYKHPQLKYHKITIDYSYDDKPPVVKIYDENNLIIE